MTIYNKKIITEQKSNTNRHQQNTGKGNENKKRTIETISTKTKNAQIIKMNEYIYTTTKMKITQDGHKPAEREKEKTYC